MKHNTVLRGDLIDVHRFLDGTINSGTTTRIYIDIIIIYTKREKGLFTLSYRSSYKTRIVRRRVLMRSSVRAAGQTRVFSIAAAVVVLLVMCLTCIVGQHEVLRES